MTDVTVVVIDDEHDDEDEDADDGVCVTDDSVPGSDLGTRGGAGSGEGSAYQVNIPET